MVFVAGKPEVAVQLVLPSVLQFKCAPEQNIHALRFSDKVIFPLCDAGTLNKEQFFSDHQRRSVTYNDILQGLQPLMKCTPLYI